ncbi:MAG: hypothetical protein ACP5P1_07945 [Acidimicrobiales bacterium]
MPWLIRDGTVLATLDEPGSDTAARSGVTLVGRWGPVHSVGSRRSLDVAWCERLPDGEGTERLVVKKARTMRSLRVRMPGLRGGELLVADAGSFERWSLRVGDVLEVRSS